MLENQTKLPLAKLGFGIAFLLSLFLFMRDGQASPKTQVALIQGYIHMYPVRELAGTPDKIQPGTPIKLSLIVENIGSFTSPDAVVYLRYAFTKPLDHLAESTIFQTEEVQVASLEPGQKVEIPFSTTHYLPSVFDFVRDDWAMREYQAVLMINQSEKIVGRAALTFSAYYYPGLAHPITVSIPIEPAAS